MNNHLFQTYPTISLFVRASLLALLFVVVDFPSKIAEMVGWRGDWVIGACTLSGHRKAGKVRGGRHTERHRGKIVFVVVAERHSAVAQKRGSRLSTLPNPP